MSRSDFLGRMFQLWAYSVSHKELLLRSTKQDGGDTRIDILFKNVGALNMPTVLHDLQIAESSASEVSFRLDPSLLQNRRVFRVQGRGVDGWIVAGLIVSHEDTLEFHEPSAIYPTGPARDRLA